jgi:hypothetical protein
MVIYNLFLGKQKSPDTEIADMLAAFVDAHLFV